MDDPTPYQICQLYKEGVIDRELLIEKLVAYPYVPEKQTDGYDSLIVDPPGTWSEVSDALRHGLIEEDVYDEVFNKRHTKEDK